MSFDVIEGGKDDPTQLTCAECRHFYPELHGPFGTCRVIAPGVDEDGCARWPIVGIPNRGCSLHTGRIVYFCEEED